MSKSTEPCNCANCSCSKCTCHGDHASQSQPEQTGRCDCGDACKCDPSCSCKTHSKGSGAK